MLEFEVRAFSASYSNHLYVLITLRDQITLMDKFLKRRLDFLLPLT